MFTIRNAIFLLIPLFVLSCKGKGEAYRVKTRTNPEEFWQRIEVHESRCHLYWIIYQQGSVNFGGGQLVYRPCSLNLKNRLPLLTKALQENNKTYGDGPPFQWLFLGPLSGHQDAQKQELSKRLAYIAMRSAQWDARLGKPQFRKKSLHSILKQMANENFLFLEYIRIFKKHGLKVQINGIEKVLISQVQDLPFSAWLLEQGAQTEDFLPYDALVWFSVEKGTKR